MNYTNIILSLTLLSLITFKATAQSYCDANHTAGCTWDFIDGVELNTISNLSTGCSAGTYSDYTNHSTTLRCGDTYTLYVTSGNYSSDYYYVWLDYNNDSDFVDTNEYLGSIHSTASYQRNSLVFTVPEIPSVKTRLRIRCTYSASYNEPCGDYSFGETEDYNITIRSYATLPYSTNFNKLDNYWKLDEGMSYFEHDTAYNSEDNIVIKHFEYSNEYTPISAFAELAIDLSSSTNPELVFKHRERKNYYPMSNKIHFSDDNGENFEEVGTFYASNGTWQTNSINIKHFTIALGLSLSDEFIIRIECSTKIGGGEESAVEIDDVSVIENPNLWHFTTGVTNPAWYKPHFTYQNRGDFDNDGDNDTIFNNALHINNSGSYDSLSNSGLLELSSMNSLWADFNNDGQVEILVNGLAGLNKYTKLYTYNGDNTFSEIPANFTGSKNIPVSADLNGDGLEDIILTHVKQYFSGYIAEIFINQDSLSFEKSESILLHENNPDAPPRLIDYDNDGDLDIFVPPTTIYRNNDGEFIHLFNNIDFSEASFYDYNGDGDMDIVTETEVYFNRLDYTKTKPSTPIKNSEKVDGQHVTLSWSLSLDTETPSKSITYNLRVGTTSKGNEVMNSYSSPSTADYYLTQPGNAFHNKTWELSLEAGTYYWSVQALDNQYLHSSFSSERSFTILPQFSDSLSLTFDYLSYVDVADFDDNGKLDIIYTDGAIHSPPDPPAKTSTLYYNYSPDSVSILDIGLNLEQGGYVYIYHANNKISYEFCGYTFNIGGLITDQLKYDNPWFGKLYGPGKSADLNNDGKNDFLFCLNEINQFSTNFSTKLFIKDTSVYTEVEHTLPDIYSGLIYQTDYRPSFTSSISIIDYDNDLDNDLFISGLDNDYEYYSQLYRNYNFNFMPTKNNITPMTKTSVDWADYDNDGDFDLLISGKDEGDNKLTLLYKNQITRFDFIDLQINHRGAVGWGDIDNDGLIDFFAGNKFYINKGNDVFIESDIDIDYPVKFLDFNNDGRLDVLAKDLSDINRKIYINNWGFVNHKPEAPENLSSELDGFDIILHWDEAADYESNGGLTYNIYVGTHPDSTDIVSPAAYLTTGFRKIVAHGNTGCNTSWKLKGLPLGTYYWSVQAIDQIYAGGVWAPVDSFSITTISTDFYADEVCLGDYTHFVDASVVDTTSELVAWKWDFGDSTGAETKNTRHIYAYADTFDVTLWAYSAADDSFHITKEVIVKPAPVASFSVETVCIGETSEFINQSDTSGIQVAIWLWDLGNGETSTSRTNISNTYANTSEASLYIEATNGCSDSVTQTVYVVEYPVIDLDPNNPLKCPGDEVSFTVSNYLKGVSYQWYIDETLTEVLTGKTYTGSTLEGEYYTVAALGECALESNRISVANLPAPDKPLLYANDGPNEYLIVCSNRHADFYQWYFNGELIPGANAYYHLVYSDYGDYFVEMKENKFDCNARSDIIQIPQDYATDVPYKAFEENHNIFPNPAADKAYVSLKSPYRGKIHIQLISTSGDVLIQASDYKTDEYFFYNLYLSHILPGIYLVKIISEDTIFDTKLIIN